MHFDSRGEAHARVILAVRFSWFWPACIFATWCSNWYSTATIHDEDDQSNVVPLRRAS